MSAKLKLTPFVPGDFPRQLLRTKPGINVNRHGKFSINKNAQIAMNFQGGDKVSLFQNDEPHTAIWLIKQDQSGWPLNFNSKAGLHFNSRHLAATIFDAFAIDELSFTFFLAEDPLEIDGEKYWILYSLKEELESFLQSIKEPEKPRNGKKVQKDTKTTKAY